MVDDIDDDWEDWDDDENEDDDIQNFFRDAFDSWTDPSKRKQDLEEDDDDESEDNDTNSLAGAEELMALFNEGDNENKTYDELYDSFEDYKDTADPLLDKLTQYAIDKNDEELLDFVIRSKEKLDSLEGEVKMSIPYIQAARISEESKDDVPENVKRLTESITNLKAQLSKANRDSRMYQSMYEYAEKELSKYQKRDQDPIPTVNDEVEGAELLEHASIFFFVLAVIALIVHSILKVVFGAEINYSPRLEVFVIVFAGILYARRAYLINKHRRRDS